MTNPYAASGGSRAAGGTGRAPADGNGRAPAGPVEDGWGPATRTSASAAASSSASSASAPTRADLFDAWTPAGPLPGREQRAARRAEEDLAHRATENAAGAYAARPAQAVRERGLPWWAGLLLLVAIAAVGGVVDTIGTTQARGGFNVGIVVASIVAVLAVRRSHMFPIVIAPPIVYSVAALFQLYLRSSGLHDKKVVFDAAANYLVYGFPAIAAATAAVLIIAGIRTIIRK